MTRLDLRLTGATTLREGEMQQRTVAIEDGCISKGPLPEVDLTGYLVLPGILDMHGDAFERHIEPRPATAFGFCDGLVATDRDAAANGVTTAWLAQGWSWEGGARSPDYAEGFLECISAYKSRMKTDIRVQIRCETHTVDSEERLLETIRKHDIRFVVFNNHLEQALQDANDAAALTAAARAAGRSARTHRAELEAARRQGHAVPRYLCRLACAFDDLGVIYGSHDDPDAETRETYAMIGAKICEFPAARAAAKLAKASNDPVIMGAPNVAQGASQAGNVSATDLIAAGYCDALVSDYDYPALAKAAFTLVDQGIADLPAAWRMISETPAEIMRLPDRGIIDHGRRADLVIVNDVTREVEATMVAGCITHLTGEAARRFLRTSSRMAIAAQ